MRVDETSLIGLLLGALAGHVSTAGPRGEAALTHSDIFDGKSTNKSNLLRLKGNNCSSKFKRKIDE